MGAGVALPAGAVPVAAWPAQGARVPAPRTALNMKGQAWRVPVANRATAINFWASWCEPCRTEMPTLQTLAELYADRLAVVAVNHKEHPRTIARYAQAAAVTLPLLLDAQGELAADWGVKVFPTTILVDAAGRPRWRVQGELDWTGPEAQRAVESLWS